MTIRSLDMQVLVQKVGEVARIQQTEQSGAHRQQQEFAQAINAQTTKNSQTTREVDQNKAELNANRDKEEHKKKSKKEAGKKTGTNDESIAADFLIDPEKGHNVDIKI
ncbi:hypothetical protein ASZ90_019052 [hydrocarbon metagenome]|uniref:Uncharacterized protein n=1 Tax=hydrocarbon metagenome TaxID=938273 RepID=A0A0W8E5I3_9ZZZZ